MFPVFQKAFNDSRRSLFWLSFGLAAYGLLMVSFFPALKEQEDEMNKIMDAYPKEMMSMFYGEADTSNISIAEVGGFVQVEFATWTLLILGVMVIWQAFSAITNTERDGTLDLMLSLPVSRRHYLLARVAHTALTLVVILTACFGGLLLSTYIWTEFEVSAGALAAAIYGAFLPLMVVACFTYWLISVVPASKKFVGGLTYFLFFGSYLIYGLSGASDTFQSIRPYFLFHYYNARDLINNGVEPVQWIGLFLTALIFLGLAWWFVDRKELAV